MLTPYVYLRLLLASTSTNMMRAAKRIIAPVMSPPLITPTMLVAVCCVDVVSMLVCVLVPLMVAVSTTLVLVELWYAVMQLVETLVNVAVPVVLLVDSMVDVTLSVVVPVEETTEVMHSVVSVVVSIVVVRVSVMVLSMMSVWVR